MFRYCIIGAMIIGILLVINTIRIAFFTYGENKNRNLIISGVGLFCCIVATVVYFLPVKKNNILVPNQTEILVHTAHNNQSVFGAEFSSFELNNEEIENFFDVINGSSFRRRIFDRKKDLKQLGPNHYIVYIFSSQEDNIENDFSNNYEVELINEKNFWNSYIRIYDKNGGYEIFKLIDENKVEQILKIISLNDAEEL